MARLLAHARARVIQNKQDPIISASKWRTKRAAAMASMITARRRRASHANGRSMRAREQQLDPVISFRTRTNQSETLAAQHVSAGSESLAGALMQPSCACAREKQIPALRN